MLNCLNYNSKLIRMFIRTFSRAIRWTFSQGKVSMVDGIPSDVSGMENISQMPFYVSFKQGLNLTLQNKLEQANQHYQQSLNMLQDRKEQLKDHYLHIYRKMIYNNFTLGKAKEVQDNIYSLIKLKKRFKVQSLLLYDDYDSLFQLFLKHNPQKAILLGRALLSQRESENISLKLRKIFLFNLANAYFLIGNYPDAKRRYSQCLESQAGPQLKPRVYNNLALACWWNKNPIIAQAQFQAQKHHGSSVDSDFKQSRELFLRAIEAAENPDGLNDEQEKYRLKQAISEYELDITAQFSSAESVLPMYNLTQYYIHNEPHQKVKILYWLRILLKLTQNYNTALFDETYTTLCLLGNQKEELNKFLPLMLSKYAGQSEEVYYSKISAIIAGSEGRASDRQALSQRASELQQQLTSRDSSVFKRKFLSIFPFKI